MAGMIKEQYLPSVPIIFGPKGLSKDMIVKCLEERCRFAETQALQAEMRVSKVMIQIYRDSPNLAASLLLSNKQALAKENNDEMLCSHDIESRQSTRISGNFSTLSVNKLTQITQDKLSQTSGEKISQLHQDNIDEKDIYAKDEELKSLGTSSDNFTLKIGGTLSIMEKLKVELWKSKKQLNTVLQERESAKNNMALLDVKEYEDIIIHLQQDLHLLRCQYTELRQALNSHHPDDILHIIGRLQDKTRKQEKIICQQQSLILSQQSSRKSMGTRDVRDSQTSRERDSNSQVTETGEGYNGKDHDNSCVFSESSGDKNSQGSGGNVSTGTLVGYGERQPSHLAPSAHDNSKAFFSASQEQQTLSQLQHASNQVKFLKEELIKTRNLMNCWRKKCQMLGEQYEQTLYTLRKMEELRGPEALVFQQKAAADLSRTQQQLNAVIKVTGILKKENEELKVRIKSMEARHNGENAQYQKNLEYLQERLKRETIELQKYQVFHAFLKQRGSGLTTCAQQVQPFMPAQRLSEVGLLVDGGKSLDTADFSMLLPENEGATVNEQKCTTPIQEEEKDISPNPEQKLGVQLPISDQDEETKTSISSAGESPIDKQNRKPSKNSQ